MKKTISLLLCCAMLILLCACGSSDRLLSSSIIEARGNEGFGYGSKLICSNSKYTEFNTKYVDADHAAKSAEEVGGYVIVDALNVAKLIDAVDGTLVASEHFLDSNLKKMVAKWSAECWDEYLFSHEIKCELSRGAEFGNGTGLLKKITDKSGAVRWEPFDSDELSANSVADSIGYVDVTYITWEDAEIAIVLGGYRFRPAVWDGSSRELTSSLEQETVRYNDPEDWRSLDLDTCVIRWGTDELDNAIEDYEFTKAMSNFSGSDKIPESYEDALKSLIFYDVSEGVYYKNRNSEKERYHADKIEDVCAVVMYDSHADIDAENINEIVDIKTGETLVEGGYRWDDVDYSSWEEYVYDDYMKKLIGAGKCTGKGLAFYDAEEDLYTRFSDNNHPVKLDYTDVDPEEVSMVVELSYTFNKESCPYYSRSTGTVEVIIAYETLEVNLVDLSTGKSFAHRTFSVPFPGFPDTLHVYTSGEKEHRYYYYAMEEFDVVGWIDSQCTSHLKYR